MRKNYLQLYPWHFQGGAAFNYGDFREFQLKAQRWADSLWLFVWYITILLGIILVCSICLPRRKKVVRAMAALGITDADVRSALQNSKSGTFAYEPTPKEREDWLDFVEKADMQAAERKAERAPKVRKTWGIVLCAMGGVVGIETLAGRASGASANGETGSMLAGAALFIGIGIFLILWAAKTVPVKEEDARTEIIPRNRDKQ